MGNTCKSRADSCQCMAKTIQYCKVISLQLIKIKGKINKIKIKKRSHKRIPYPRSRPHIQNRWSRKGGRKSKLQMFNKSDIKTCQLNPAEVHE